MSKTTSITVHFYLEGELHLTAVGLIPKAQSDNIPQLGNLAKKFQTSPNISTKNNKKVQQNDENEMIDEMDEIQNDNQDEEVQRVLQEVQMELQEQNIQQQLGDDEQEDADSDDDSLSVIPSKFKTKRQKGLYQEFVELPDKKPRKKKGDQIDDIVRRQQKQQKRKNYLQKQTQAQQKATLDKILNQTGRKLRLREQKQNQDEFKRQNRQFRTLGDVPKVITITNSSGYKVLLHKTQLFPNSYPPDIKMKQLCSQCNNSIGKYKIINTNKYACSLECYKKLKAYK